MNKLNVILTVALFIVTGLLIGVVMNQPADAGSNYKMKCKHVGDTITMERCENIEVICYDGKGTFCFKK